MKFNHKATVAAPKDKVWARLMDIPAAARCVPGVASVRPNGKDRYQGTLAVSAVRSGRRWISRSPRRTPRPSFASRPTSPSWAGWANSDKRRSSAKPISSSRTSPSASRAR
ncbi:MAG: hypothetical protein E6H87_05560 [Chloroflexi bacterium]|nr:MAG: hypothetical protein E6H87_05560 [Chloroflexota bacterium]